MFDKTALKVALGGVALELEDATTVEGVRTAVGNLIDALAEHLCEEEPDVDMPPESTHGGDE